MGEIKKIICGECDASWEIKVGTGRLHLQKKYIIQYFNEYDQKEIEALWEKGADYHFNLQSGYCENCKKFMSKPMLDMDGIEKKYMGICMKCKNKMTDIQLGEIECPRCRKIKWTEKFIGMWD